MAAFGVTRQYPHTVVERDQRNTLSLLAPAHMIPSSRAWALIVAKYVCEAASLHDVRRGYASQRTYDPSAFALCAVAQAIERPQAGHI